MAISSTKPVPLTDDQVKILFALGREMGVGQPVITQRLIELRNTIPESVSTNEVLELLTINFPTERAAQLFTPSIGVTVKQLMEVARLTGNDAYQLRAYCAARIDGQSNEDAVAALKEPTHS